MTRRKGEIGWHYKRKRSINKKLTINIHNYSKPEDNTKVNRYENGVVTTLRQDIATYIAENRTSGWKGEKRGRGYSPETVK